MTRKRFIKLVMGNIGFSRDEAVRRANLANEYNIPYEISYHWLYRINLEVEKSIQKSITIDPEFFKSRCNTCCENCESCI